MRDELLVPLEPAAISDAVVERLARRYRARLPLIDGASEAVERIAARWPLALASSSNPSIIELVLAESGLARHFAFAVSSEDAGRGKPAPDVYLVAAQALGIPPDRAAAVEDSANGIRAARAAGMRVVAIPNPHFPPGEDALDAADVVLGSIAELTPAVIEG
jgi:HAD superfamily hydrolase (TIGR01509 family)